MAGGRGGGGGCKTALRFSHVRVSLRACGQASVSFRATAFRVYPGTLIVRISDCAATTVRLVSAGLNSIRHFSRASPHYLIDLSLINASRLFNFTRAS